MDNFGSAYAVGGFGQGFAQGMGIVQKQQELDIQKQKAAREQDEYNRSLAQHDIQGAYAYLDGQVEQHKMFQSGKSTSDGDIKGAWDKVNEISQKYHTPTINDYQSPEMAKHIQAGERAFQNVQGGMPIHQALNQPDMIDSINYRYDEQLNHDEKGNPLNEKTDRVLQGERGNVIPQGATAVKRKIVGFVPGGGGTVHPELEVTFQWKDKDGTTRYDTIKDPMTEGRSILASDNKLKAIPIEKLLDQHAFDRNMWQTLNDPGLKATLQGAYISQGGKPEEFEPLLKKTQMEQNAQFVDPRDGIAKIGTLVRDYKGNVDWSKSTGVPITESSGYLGAYFRGAGAASIRAKMGAGQKNAMYNILVEAYRKQGYDNPEALAWQGIEREKARALLPQVMKQLRDSNQFKQWDPYDLYQAAWSQLTGDIGETAVPTQRPGEPAPAEPQPTNRGQSRTIYSKSGEPLTQYENGDIEDSKGNKVDPQTGNPIPKKIPTPGIKVPPQVKPKGKGISLVDQGNLQYWTLQKKNAKSLDEYNRASDEIEKIQKANR